MDMRTTLNQPSVDGDAVGLAVDHAKVSVGPDVGEAVEVGLAVAFAIGVVHKVRRHAWEGLPANELSAFVRHRMT